MHSFRIPSPALSCPYKRIRCCTLLAYVLLDHFIMCCKILVSPSLFIWHIIVLGYNFYCVSIKKLVELKNLQGYYFLIFFQCRFCKQNGLIQLMAYVVKIKILNNFGNGRTHCSHVWLHIDGDIIASTHSLTTIQVMVSLTLKDWNEEDNLSHGV